MAKCRVCKEEQSNWAWQPFGPGGVGTFITEGSHYRGFAVIKICDSCKDYYELGGQTVFTYKYNLYQITVNLIEQYTEDGFKPI